LQFYDAHEYVYMEIAALESEMKAIDEKAHRLEGALRRAMYRGTLINCASVYTLPYYFLCRGGGLWSFVV